MKIRPCNLLRAKCCLFLRSQAAMNPVWSGMRRQLAVWVTVRDYTQWESNWSWINNSCAGIPSFSVSEEAAHSSFFFFFFSSDADHRRAGLQSLSCTRCMVKHLTPVDRGWWISAASNHPQPDFIRDRRVQTFDCFWSALSLSVDGAKNRLRQAVGCVISIQYAHPPRALPSLSLIDGTWT